MQLNNHTPFSAQNALLLNENGVETCFTLVKPKIISWTPQSVLLRAGLA